MHFTPTVDQGAYRDAYQKTSIAELSKTLNIIRGTLQNIAEKTSADIEK